MSSNSNRPQQVARKRRDPAPLVPRRLARTRQPDRQHHIPSRRLQRQPAPPAESPATPAASPPPSAPRPAWPASSACIRPRRLAEAPPAHSAALGSIGSGFSSAPAPPPGRSVSAEPADLTAAPARSSPWTLNHSVHVWNVFSSFRLSIRASRAYSLVTQRWPRKSPAPSSPASPTIQLEHTTISPPTTPAA